MAAMVTPLLHLLAPGKGDAHQASAEPQDVPSPPRRLHVAMARAADVAPAATDAIKAAGDVGASQSHGKVPTGSKVPSSSPSQSVSKATWPQTWWSPPIAVRRHRALRRRARHGPGPPPPGPSGVEQATVDATTVIGRMVQPTPPKGFQRIRSDGGASPTDIGSRSEACCVRAKENRGGGAGRRAEHCPGRPPRPRDTQSTGRAPLDIIGFS